MVFLTKYKVTLIIVTEKRTGALYGGPSVVRRPCQLSANLMGQQTADASKTKSKMNKT